MSAFRRHWLYRKGAYWSMLLYVSIDALTSVHNWMLSNQDWSVLTFRDYSILSVSTILSALITLKALQSSSWHKNGEIPNANTQ